MTDKRAMWTYYKGEWREGDVRILGAASQATWLGSLVFDGARLFEGVTPDLDRHSARANDSARALGLEPTLSANDIEALAREGLKKFTPGTDVYIRPMYWAEEGDASAVAPLASSADFALCLEAILWSSPRVHHHNNIIPSTISGSHASQRQGGLPLSNNARMLREAKAKGFNNALVTDVVGNVAETATSNVFMVRGGEVFTPVPNGTF